MQKALAAEAQLTEARAKGRKLAKEVLDDFMHLFVGVASHYQPVGADGNPNPGFFAADNAEIRNQFERWGMNACTVGHWLAPFQSPTYRSVTLQTPQPDRTQYQDGAAEAVKGLLDQLADALKHRPPLLTLSPVRIGDPVPDPPKYDPEPPAASAELPVEGTLDDGTA